MFFLIRFLFFITCAKHYFDCKLSSKIYFHLIFRKARYNIFRRVWRMPMDFVEYNILNKMYVDWRRAKAVRGTITMFGGIGVVMMYFSYYTLYCANDWSSVSTLMVFIIPVRNVRSMGHLAS